MFSCAFMIDRHHHILFFVFLTFVSMIHKTILACMLFLSCAMLKAQKWVDTLYQVQITSDVEFGQATDFGGKSRNLKMDICRPLNDSLPPCGRPLMVIIHGGAFLGGDKTGDAMPKLLKEFAQRGYLTASINYRLGFFQTSAAINCNIPTWNCLNTADSAEWGRALYRGMQDAKAAIRFLVAKSSVYKIDPRNVFVVGESAGAFVALSAAFMDDPAEKPASCAQMADVARPNKIYESQCVVAPGLGASVDSLKLQRPDLGTIDGSLNLPVPSYTIKGVGSFYGGMYNDLFSTSKYVKQPVLYMFHQPNDLVVPYAYDRLFAGYNACAKQFPANCQDIINRPFVMGSAGINRLVRSLRTSGKPVPEILFDSTLNTADCLAQVGNPALAGHAIDNLSLRSMRMAGFFAKAIDTSSACQTTSIRSLSMLASAVTLFPNPASRFVDFESGFQVQSLEIIDMTSKVLMSVTPASHMGHIDIQSLQTGIYVVRLQGPDGSVYKTLRID
jgi:dienelactone hydrolase